MTNIITPVNLDDLDGIEADANQAAQVRKLRSRVAALEAQLKEAGHKVALT